MDKGLSKKEILIMELIKGVYDSKLRQELIHNLHETSYDRLVKIAKNMGCNKYFASGACTGQSGRGRKEKYDSVQPKEERRVK